MLVEIEIEGCDAVTYITMNLRKAQIDLLQQLAALSVKNSSCRCEPTIEIKVPNE